MYSKRSNKNASRTRCIGVHARCGTIGDEFARVLKPGGCLLISVPNSQVRSTAGTGWYLRLGRRWGGDGCPLLNTPATNINGRVRSSADGQRLSNGTSDRVWQSDSALVAAAEVGRLAADVCGGPYLGDSRMIRQKNQRRQTRGGGCWSPFVAVSVIVAARNEAHNLPRCLDAVRNFGEVYVIDSTALMQRRNCGGKRGEGRAV